MVPRALFAFVFPGGFLVLAAILLAQTGVLADWMPLLKRVYPNVALAAGLLLGWRFNRSRMVFVIRGANRPPEKPRRRKSVKGSSNRVGVTISIGVAERNERYPTAEDVVKAADAALYRAKRAGRNRIGF